MTEEVARGLYIASVVVLPLLFAITLHEAAHGYVAWRLGDDTAKRMGRVSFNPIRHIDPVGTVILPALLLISGSPILFGYAKPVPVDFTRLRNPRGHMVLVALAGPGTNIALAILSAVLLHIVPLFPDMFAAWAGEVLQFSIIINLLLAVFNMIPLPPLDGGRVAVGLGPDFIAGPLARLERFGFIILLFILFLLPIAGNALGMDINIFASVILPAVEYLLEIVFLITGN